MGSRIAKIPELRRKRPMTYWLLFAGTCYLLWCTALLLLQERLIFPGWWMRGERGLFARPHDAEVLRVGPLGVEAWLLPGRGVSPQRPGPLVIFAHGNGELTDDWPPQLQPYRDAGLSVLLVEYRGYGRSPGTPGQRGIVEDFVAAYDAVVARREIDPRRVVLHGRSIGGGVLVQLAARRPPAALVLESTFTSLTAMARGYLVPTLLLRHPFRSDRVLTALDVPALILHGTRDDIIPVVHARRLAKIARRAELVEFDARHNDFPPDEEAYWRTIRSFLHRAGILTETR